MFIEVTKLYASMWNILSIFYFALKCSICYTNVMEDEYHVMLINRPVEASGLQLIHKCCYIYTCARAHIMAKFIDFLECYIFSTAACIRFLFLYKTFTVVLFQFPLQMLGCELLFFIKYKMAFHINGHLLKYVSVFFVGFYVAKTL